MDGIILHWSALRALVGQNEVDRIKRGHLHGIIHLDILREEDLCDLMGNREAFLE